MAIVLSDLSELKQRGLKEIQSYLFKCSQVVVTTTITAASNLGYVQFQVGVIEEGSMVTESSGLVAAMRGARMLLISGDPVQLKPVVPYGTKIAKMLREISLMVRLGTVKKKVIDQLSFYG